MKPMYFSSPSSSNAPSAPHPTSSSAFSSQRSKVGRAPIINPYDKFTQPQFDDWIGDITGLLKRALGQEGGEEEAPRRGQPEFDNFSHTGFVEEEEESSFAEEEYNGEADDTFHNIRSRRLDKGKGRDLGEQLDLFTDGTAESPIDLSSDTEEGREEEYEEVYEQVGYLPSDAEEHSDGSGPVSSSPPYLNGLVDYDPSDEDASDAEPGIADSEEVIEIISDDEDGELALPTSRNALVYESEEDKEEGETQVTLPVEKEEEEEAAENEEEENMENDQALVNAQDESEFLEDEEDDVNDASYAPIGKFLDPRTQDAMGANAVLETPNVVDETSFQPPSDSSQCISVKAGTEPPNDESAHVQPLVERERIVIDASPAQIALPLPVFSPGSSHEVLPDELEVDNVEEHQPLQEDTSFPPHGTDEIFDTPIALRDPWEGPQMYAEDYYAGGSLTTISLNPHMIGELDTPDDVDISLVPQTATSPEHFQSLDVLPHLLADSFVNPPISTMADEHPEADESRYVDVSEAMTEFMNNTLQDSSSSSQAFFAEDQVSTSSINIETCDVTGPQLSSLALDDVDFNMLAEVMRAVVAQTDAGKMESNEIQPSTLPLPENHTEAAIMTGGNSASQISHDADQAQKLGDVSISPVSPTLQPDELKRPESVQSSAQGTVVLDHSSISSPHVALEPTDELQHSDNLLSCPGIVSAEDIVTEEPSEFQRDMFIPSTELSQKVIDKSSEPPVSTQPTASDIHLDDVPVEESCEDVTAHEDVGQDVDVPEVCEINKTNAPELVEFPKLSTVPSIPENVTSDTVEDVFLHSTVMIPEPVKEEPDAVPIGDDIENTNNSPTISVFDIVAQDGLHVLEDPSASLLEDEPEQVQTSANPLSPELGNSKFDLQDDESIHIPSSPTPHLVQVTIEKFPSTRAAVEQERDTSIEADSNVQLQDDTVTVTDVQGADNNLDEFFVLEWDPEDSTILNPVLPDVIEEVERYESTSRHDIDINHIVLDINPDEADIQREYTITLPAEFTDVSRNPGDSVIVLELPEQNVGGARVLDVSPEVEEVPVFVEGNVAYTRENSLGAVSISSEIVFAMTGKAPKGLKRKANIEAIHAELLDDSMSHRAPSPSPIVEQEVHHDLVPPFKRKRRSSSIEAPSDVFSLPHNSASPDLKKQESKNGRKDKRRRFSEALSDVSISSSNSTEKMSRPPGTDGSRASQPRSTILPTAKEIVIPFHRPSISTPVSKPLVQSTDTSPTLVTPTKPLHIKIPPPHFLHNHSGRPMAHHHQISSRNVAQRQVQRTQNVRLSEPPLSPSSTQSDQPVTPVRAEVHTMTEASHQSAHHTRSIHTPVTRSNCRYHKISLPLEDDGEKLYFIVPGCSLVNRKFMGEEDIVDEGYATFEEGQAMAGDIETLDLPDFVISVLKNLVGLDMEQEVFYCPRSNESIIRIQRSSLKSPEKVTLLRAADSTSQHSPISTVSSSTTRRKNRNSEYSASVGGSTRSESSDDENGETPVKYRNPSGVSRKSVKLKRKLAESAAEYKPHLEDSSDEEGKPPTRKRRNNRGIKRTRTHEDGNGTPRTSKRIKTQGSMPI